MVKRHLFLRLFFCKPYYKNKDRNIIMLRTSVALLHCAEYNSKKLKEHWGEPESPEQALRWNLEAGLAKCVKTLLVAEQYSWNKPKTGGRSYPWTKKEKKPPKKLRQLLYSLVNNPAPTQTESERVAELRAGIWDAVMYLRNIKEDKNYLNSTVLQNVQEYLEYLLELEIPQISKTNKPGELPMR